MLVTDFLDPTTWDAFLPQGPRRVFLSDSDDSLFALIDPDDYAWVSRHRWSIVKSRARGDNPRKLYAVRKESGWSGGRTIYLHKEVLERSGIKPPSDKHVIGDHRNGDSLDCRKINLRWATHAMNAKNLYGRYGHDLTEAAHG